MPELISNSTQKARKVHKCQLCNGDIPIGEVYRRQFLKYDGQVYDFKEHDRCGEIASFLWNFIDPDEGMTEDDFKEGCQYYCGSFVCPACEYWNDKSEEEDCKKGEVYCLDRILERLKTHGLKRDGWGWKEFERKAGES